MSIKRFLVLLLFTSALNLALGKPVLAQGCNEFDPSILYDYPFVKIYPDDQVMTQGDLLTIMLSDPTGLGVRFNDAFVSFEGMSNPFPTNARAITFLVNRIDNHSLLGVDMDGEVCGTRFTVTVTRKYSVRFPDDQQLHAQLRYLAYWPERQTVFGKKNIFVYGLLAHGGKSFSPSHEMYFYRVNGGPWLWIGSVGEIYIIGSDLVADSGYVTVELLDADGQIIRATVPTAYDEQGGVTNLHW